MRSIPTHDPQTGELNPYYEELTGEKNPLSVDKEETEQDYLQGFIDQFGDGPLGEQDLFSLLDKWTAPDFLRWLKLNKYKIIKEKKYEQQPI